MNSELRDRSLMVGLLLIAWAVLVYLKTVLNASVLPDLNAIIAQVQVLMGGVVGYHVGTGAGSPAAALPQTPAPAVAIPGQAGHSLWAYPLLLLSIALGLALVGGCTSLTQAGNTAYTVEPVADKDGKLVCCRFTANDGKEFSGRNIAFQKDDSGGLVLQVQEGASTAFQGQAIAGKALSVLPSFAPLLLPPGPATVVPQLERALPAAPLAPVPATGPKV